MMFKRTTLALILAGFTATAVAGTMGNPVEAPAGINVVAPTTSGTWVFGLEAIYARPNQVFQYAETGQPSVSGATFKNHSGPADYDWGISADIGYIFADSGLDLQLSYTYLDMGDDNRMNNIGNIFPVLSGPNSAATLGTGFDTSHTNTDQDLNQVYLTVGQAIKATKFVYLHPSIGLQYANLRVLNNVNYADAISTARITDKSVYNGVGPRAGIDGAFHLGYGFSIFGSAAGALLIGEMNSSFEAVSTRTGTTNNFHNDNNVVLVPEVEGKIGLEYFYPMTPNADIRVQLGYEAVNYFNGESQDLIDVTAVNATTNLSNFAFQGFFIRLQQSFR